MKRALLFIFMTVCVLGMSACSSKDAMPETSDSASNPVHPAVWRIGTVTFGLPRRLGCT